MSFAQLRAGTIVAAVAAVVVMVSGCGSLPTSPVAVSPGAGVRASNESQGAMASTMPSDETADGQGGSETPPAGSSAPATGAPIRQVTSLQDGGSASLRNGRWQIDVPTGAVEGPARIALTVANAKSFECALEILPSTKNQFAVPVKVTVFCHGGNPSRLANFTLFCFDDASQLWVPVEDARVDTKKKTVTASIAHFGRYRVGPAGTSIGL